MVKSVLIALLLIVIPFTGYISYTQGKQDGFQSALLVCDEESGRQLVHSTRYEKTLICTYVQNGGYGKAKISRTKKL